MGKGDRKTKAKRNRQAFNDAMPALASTPRPKARGKARMGQIKEETQSVVLDARARQAGEKMKPERTRDDKPNFDNIAHNKGVRSKMRTEAYGEAAGMALYLSRHTDTAAKLWGVYRGLTAAEQTYTKVKLGLSLHAKTAKIEMMPETFEAREDDKPDLRSEDERHRDAVNGWMRWQGLVMRLPSHQQSALWAVVRERVMPVVSGRVTKGGREFVEAMDALAEQVGA